MWSLKRGMLFFWSREGKWLFYSFFFFFFCLCVLSVDVSFFSFILFHSNVAVCALTQSEGCELCVARTEGTLKGNQSTFSDCVLPLEQVSALHVFQQILTLIS